MPGSCDVLWMLSLSPHPLALSERGDVGDWAGFLVPCHVQCPPHDIISRHHGGGMSFSIIADIAGVCRCWLRRWLPVAPPRTCLNRVPLVVVHVRVGRKYSTSPDTFLTTYLDRLHFTGTPWSHASNYFFSFFVSWCLGTGHGVSVYFSFLLFDLWFTTITSFAQGFTVTVVLSEYLSSIYPRLCIIVMYLYIQLNVFTT